METKIFELRDSATFIAIVAINMNPDNEKQQFLLRRSGYACDGVPTVLVTRIDGSGKSYYDPYDWNDRTFTIAHDYIIKQWNRLNDGNVVDVEYILGERKEKKVSEAFNAPY